MLPVIAKAIPSLIFGTVLNELQKAAQDPRSPIVVQDPVRLQEAAKEIAVRVEQRVATAPELQHLASNEKWYQSRANWSAIVATVTPLVAIGAGYNMTTEEQLYVAGFLALVGNGVAAYLARRARTATKPLGAK